METYNDFSLPNDRDILIMQDMYNKSLFNKNSCLSTISDLANEFLSQCYGVEKKTNARINLALEELKKDLNLLLENLELIFSFKTSSKINNIKEFNLFSCLKIINQLITHLIILSSKEDKVYLKKFAYNTLRSILEDLNKLFDALSNSFIRMFRYL